MRAPWIASLVPVLAALACGKAKRSEAPAPVDPPQIVAVPRAVDLLRFTPAVVAVSSKVDNPKDFPEHIVDGKSGTAWNGKTGDLVGGWVAFRVPGDAVVKRIELTAGFDEKKDGKDLFTMNVRIARVRVSRAGKTVKEATLDTDVRGMQSIDVDEPGGDFRIEVLETKPGTRADYKELCVSEIAVAGLAGATRFDAPLLPHVFVGSLEGPSIAERGRPHAAAVAVGPYPSPEAFCEAQKKAAAPELERIWGSGERYPGKIPAECSIVKLAPAPKLAPPFRAAVSYDANEAEYGVTGVLLETDRGWFLTPWVQSTHAYDDPGCLHAGYRKLVEIASPDEHLPLVWMRYSEADSSWMEIVTGPDGHDTTASWSTWLDRLDVCRVEPGTGVLACDATRELGRARVEEGGPDFLETHAPPYRPRTPRIGDGGAIELVP